MTTYKINHVEGHLLISDNGSIILVDTGSPVTIHKEETFSFLGREFNVQTSFAGQSVEALNALARIEFTTLMGMDILGQFKVIFDYANGEITFLDPDEAGIEGNEYPLDNVMGCIAMEMTINSTPLKMVIDTGAPLSYVDETVTSALEPVGQREDFNPMAGGRYTTPVFNLEAEFDGKRFSGEFGRLPGILAMSLRAMGLDGAIGTIFFNSFKLMFNFADRKVTVAR